MGFNGIGRKTILVVDDNAMVLGLVTAILNTENYNVLGASGPIEALQIESEYPDPIDLLLSDITMPVMSGSQLAAKIFDHRPEIRVMFMSGYSEEASLLILNHGWRLLEKPFLRTALLGMIDKILHSPINFRGTNHADTR